MSWGWVRRGEGGGEGEPRGDIAVPGPRPSTACRLGEVLAELKGGENEVVIEITRAKTKAWAMNPRTAAAVRERRGVSPEEYFVRIVRVYVRIYERVRRSLIM